MDIAKLKVEVSSEEAIEGQKALRQELDKTDKQNDRQNAKRRKQNKDLEKSYGEVANAVAVFKRALIALPIVASVREYIKAREELLRLRGALISTGQDTIGYIDNLTDQAEALQRVTRFADEMIYAVQRQLVLFGAQRKDMEALTALTLDYAEATGQSTDAISTMVGKAIQGEFQMFKRMGIQVDETRSKTEQLQQVLQEMERRSKGRAQFLGDSDIGAIAKATNAISDLTEETGRFFLILGKSAIHDFVEFVYDLRDGFKAINDVLEPLSDNPFIKFLTRSTIGNVKNMFEAIGMLAYGAPLQDVLETLESGIPDAAAEAESSLKDVAAAIDSGEIQKAKGDLEEFRKELEILAEKSPAEAQAIQSAFQFEKMGKELQAVVSKLIEAGEATAALDAEMAKLVTKAGERQAELINRMRELEKLRNDVFRSRYGQIETGPDGQPQMKVTPELDINAEIKKQRYQTSETTDSEAYEHETAKLEILVAERNRRLEADMMKPAEAFKTGWIMAVEEFGNLSQRIASIGATLAQSIETNLTDALVDAIFEAKNLGQAFHEMTQQIMRDLVRAAIQKLIVDQLLGAFGGILGGGSGGAGGGVINNYYHEGGIVRQKYAGGGVAGDEVPVIAHQGEVIFNERQFEGLMSGMGGGGKQSPRVDIINVTDLAMVDEYMAQNPAAVLNVISRYPKQVKAALGIRA